MPIRPSFLRNLGFWLAAVALGTVLLFPATLLYSRWNGARSSELELVPIMAGIGAMLSVAALPLLLPLLPWALTADTLPGRWARVALLQGAALALLIWLALQLDDDFDRISWFVGPVFSLGGLLAAALVYGAWLRPAAAPAHEG